MILMLQMQDLRFVILNIKYTLQIFILIPGEYQDFGHVTRHNSMLEDFVDGDLECDFIHFVDLTWSSCEIRNLLLA